MKKIDVILLWLAATVLVTVAASFFLEPMGDEEWSMWEKCGWYPDTSALPMEK